MASGKAANLDSRAGTLTGRRRTRQVPHFVLPDAAADRNAVDMHVCRRGALSPQGGLFCQQEAVGACLEQGRRVRQPGVDIRNQEECTK